MFEPLTEGLGSLLSALRADRGTIWRAEGEGHLLALARVYPAIIGSELGEHPRRTLSSEEWATLTDHGVLEYVRVDASWWLSPGDDDSGCTARLLLLGLRASEELVGVLALGFPPSVPDLDPPMEMLRPYTRTVARLLTGTESHDSSGVLPAASVSMCVREELDHAAREEARLASLAYLEAVRSEADEVLQGLVDEVRSLFRTDQCMVNLLTKDVQHFHAWSGDLPTDLVEARQDPRDRGMCQYVVDTEMPLVVRDFLATKQFRNQHFCVNYGIRFYAGTPLITAEGHVIRSLCLLHTQPREFTENDTMLIGIFARAVVARLELLGSLARERVLYSARGAVHRPPILYAGRGVSSATRRRPWSRRRLCYAVWSDTEPGR